MSMERERWELRRVILDRLDKIDGLFLPSLEDIHSFADWVIDNFRVAPCESKLARTDGGLELCKLRRFHEGDHVFESSIRVELP